jgi:predicted negative regulator of RcsB-dependent stress response
MSADLKNAPVPLAEISQGPNAFEEFLDRNQKNLVALAVVLALGAAGLVIYRGVEKSGEETAGAALNKAEDLTSLQSVVDQYAKTSAGGSAMVLLANKQWTEGQQDAAIATLQKFIAANSDHPAIPTAQASLGAKLMTQGKSAEAAKVFQALADNPNAKYIAPFALISLGDLEKAGGDLEKAEASYNKVKSDFADSSFAETAGRRLTILKAKPPVEVDPPPAPPAPPAASEGNTPPPSLLPPPAAPSVELPAAPTPEETPATPQP